MINAGGALAFGLAYALKGTELSNGNLIDRMTDIGTLIESVLEESSASGIPTYQVAQSASERRLEAAKRAGQTAEQRDETDETRQS